MAADDEYETVWSPELEKQGRAPRLSGYRGGSSLRPPPDKVAREQQFRPRKDAGPLPSQLDPDRPRR